MTRRPVAAAWAEAQAKVNLGLAVTSRRADGYHTLRSVFVRLALHDHLEVRPAADPAGPDELVIEDHAAGAAPHVPGSGDLILRAAAALRVGHPGRRLPALRFRLDKHIPVAAGLAGGSSDAAAALELAAAAWELVVDRPELLALAAGVGADVPFFVANHAAALVGGIGEVLEGLPAPHPPAGVLLVTAADRLLTADVFAELDRIAGTHASADAGPTIQAPGPATIAVQALAAALRSGLDGVALADLAPMLRDANDLWPAASRRSPRLAEARDALESRLGRPVLLTGSGPTLLAVYPSMAAAGDAAIDLEGDRPSVLRDATITATSSSPRGGSS